MSNHKKRNAIFGGLSMLSIIFATSCIKEEVSECWATCTLEVRAYTCVDGEDASGDVDDVNLYLFDDDMLFMECIATRVGEKINVRIPQNKSVTAVAWGNLDCGNQTKPVFEPGDPIENGSVDLIRLMATRATNGVTSPDDLFYGAITIVYDEMAAIEGFELPFHVNEILPIYRKTGRMNITIRGLRQHFGFDDSEYTVRINASNRAVGFDGDLLIGEVFYLPEGEFDKWGEFHSPSFNMLPGTGMTVDILHDGTLLATVSATDYMNVINVLEGLTTNLFIDYLRQQNVLLEITDWNEITIWKEL